MSKNSLKILMLCALGLFTLHAAVFAQTPAPTWRAAVYDAFSGELIFIGADATAEPALTLPLPDASAYPHTVALSTDGATLAYVTYGAPPMLHFMDVPTATLTSQPLPADLTTDSLSFIASSALFTPNGEVFAFGYAQASGAWQLATYSRAAGWAASATLTDVQLPLALASGRTPIVQQVDANGVVRFLLAQTFSGYQEGFETAYLWNPADGSVSATEQPASVDSDTLPDGAQLALLLDINQPNTAFSFPYPQMNALYLTPPNSTARLLTVMPQASMFWARFVGGGNAVLVGSYTADNRAAWTLLNLDGATLDTFAPVQMSALLGTPNGFAYTVEAGANLGTLLYRVDLLDGRLAAPLELWSGAPNASYRLVWVG